jgi:gas vesicle protein
MSQVISFIRGAVIGGLIGAGVTLLLTPSSGDELREQMKERAERLQIEVRQAAETRRAEMEQQLEMLRTPRK